MFHAVGKQNYTWRVWSEPKKLKELSRRRKKVFEGLQELALNPLVCTLRGDIPKIRPETASNPHSLSFFLTVDIRQWRSFRRRRMEEYYYGDAYRKGNGVRSIHRRMNNWFSPFEYLYIKCGLFKLVLLLLDRQRRKQSKCFLFPLQFLLWNVSILTGPGRPLRDVPTTRTL